jgi:hypothetical protein
MRMWNVEGLHSDVNATYPVGQIDDESKKLIRTTRECLDEAIKICKPGALIRDIGKTMFVPLLFFRPSYLRLLLMLTYERLCLKNKVNLSLAQTGVLLYAHTRVMV